MAAKRTEGSQNSTGNPARSTRSRASTGPLGLQWTIRTDEVYTTVTADGLVCIVSRVCFADTNGPRIDGQWQSKVTGESGVTLMQGVDADKDVAFASVGDFLHALSIARERDPQPH